MYKLNTSKRTRSITTMTAYLVGTILVGSLLVAEFPATQMAAGVNGVAVDLLRPTLGMIHIAEPNADGAIDVVVEVSSLAEDVSIDANDRTKTKKLTSGVYDLRLFRDGQLIGTSASRERLQAYIDRAPAEVAKDMEAFKRDPKNASLLLNTNEDKLWRDANVIIPNDSGGKAYSGNTCVIDPKTPTKAVCTFKNIKLPRDNRKEIEFTAYAFNADRVKSDTASYKYQLPASIASAPAKKGRAYLISIGVNASENPLFDLQYAANDARKMQEVVGSKLKAETDKYSDVIVLPLISDYSKDQKTTDEAPAENGARKAIIEGVFALLEGRTMADVTAEIAISDPSAALDFRKIPNIDVVAAVEPEDTLIITYSGHGYADQAGIFYLLPYDIGRNSVTITPEVLKRLISSDELSLWMREITSTEMVLVIDACHSSAAVQGDGFKPGPMGSRGLGQLSYDKGMKILSATQADNVALELGGSLQQGLLSYALLQDGIVGSNADADHDKKLTTTEWLSYAVSRVPSLYDEVKAGKHTVIVDGIKSPPGTQRDVTSFLSGKKPAAASSINLQQPTLFDFKRRNQKKELFVFN